MTFGDEASEGWGASRAEARRIFDVFTEAGGNFIDTAVNYCGGVSEQYFAFRDRALRVVPFSR